VDFFFQGYSKNLAFCLVGDLKKSLFAGPESFLRFETDIFISEGLDIQKSKCRLKGRII